MTIFEQDGAQMAVLTLGFTLFYELDALSKTAAVLHSAIDMTAPDATWYRIGANRRNERVSGGAIRRIHEYLSDACNRSGECFVFIDSGATVQDVGETAFKLACLPYPGSNVLGYFQLHMPCCDVRKTGARLAALFSDCVADGAFVHGYAGFAINFDHGDLNEDRDVAMRAYCERFLGVSLTDLLTESEQLVAAVKGAQWLTYVGDGLLRREEEQSEVIRSAADATVTPNGVLLKAGGVPRLGDRRKREDMESYRRVNALLGPWLVDGLWPMPGFADEEAVRSWLHRLRPES